MCSGQAGLELQGVHSILKGILMVSGCRAFLDVKIAFMPSPLKIDFKCMVLLGHCMSGIKQLQTVFYRQVVGTL